MNPRPELFSFVVDRNMSCNHVDGSWICPHREIGGCERQVLLSRRTVPAFHSHRHATARLKHMSIYLFHIETFEDFQSGLASRCREQGRHGYGHHVRRHVEWIGLAKGERVTAHVFSCQNCQEFVHNVRTCFTCDNETAFTRPSKDCESALRSIDLAAFNGDSCSDRSFHDGSSP